MNQDTLDILKYFISSNGSTVELENQHLRNFLSRYNVQLPTRKSFTNELVPNLVDKVKRLIEIKLQAAFSITLIVDIWSSAQMSDFIGLSASITDKNFNKKLLVLGLDRMPGPHNAENIKIAVEKITNQYTFDKSKIKGVVCDEGSSLVRLFKQLTSFLGIEIDELEEIKDDDQLDKEEMVVRVADVDEEITDLINNDLIPLQDKLDASQLQDGDDNDDDELNESEDESNEYNLSDGSPAN